MVLVSSNVSLEPYDGSRSKKSYNIVRRILSVVYFHCKTNIATNFEKSCSKISNFRLKNVPRNPVGTESLPGLRRLRICGADLSK